jgi:hypothetical protein
VIEPVVFPTDIKLCPLDAEREGRGLFRLDEELPVRLFGETITIPQGYVTDGASIPWFARGLVDVWGRDGRPAILHDWLWGQRDWPKWLIDLVFLLALKAEGVSDLRATLMYLAVRTAHRPPARPGA